MENNIFNFVTSKIKIEDVAKRYTTLEPTIGYLKGKCPIHEKKENPFTISTDKQIFYCFNCHAGGDVITLIAKLQNISQYEAAIKLAKEFNIEIPKNLMEPIKE